MRKRGLEPPPGVNRTRASTVYLVASGQFSFAEVMVFLSARLSSSPELLVCIVTPLRGFLLVGFCARSGEVKGAARLEGHC